MINFGWFDIRQSSLTDVPQVYKIDSESMVSSFAEDSFINKVEYHGDMFLVATGCGLPDKSAPLYGYIVGSPNEVYTRTYKGYIYLSRFAVKNMVRRRGIGTALLTVLENYMRATGKYRGIILDVRASNTASLTFFRKHGYIVSKNRSRPEGYTTGDTRMERYKVVMYKKFPVVNC
jgi:ribosomal protein S18 acetylase RimI-like enzyme